MALADETNSIVSQFDFTDDDLNRHVQEFLRQMSMSFSLRRAQCPLEHSVMRLRLLVSLASLPCATS